MGQSTRNWTRGATGGAHGFGPVVMVTDGHGMDMEVAGMVVMDMEAGMVVGIMDGMVDGTVDMAGTVAGILVGLGGMAVGMAVMGGTKDGKPYKKRDRGIPRKLSKSAA